NADSTLLVTASEDGTARIWSAEDGMLRATLEGHRGAVLEAHFMADGLRVVTASKDRTIRFWNADNGRLITTLHGHLDEVVNLEFDETQERMLSASLDGTARLWMVPDYDPKPNEDLPNVLQLTTERADGKRAVIFSGHYRSEDKVQTARVVNTQSG